MTAAYAPAFALAVVASSAWTAPRPAEAQPLPSMTQGPAPTAKQQTCVRDFMEFRGAIEKQALAVVAAAKKKIKREELCNLVTAYSAAEVKWIAFSSANRARCGFTEEIVAQITQAHARTEQARAKLCGGPRKRLNDFQKIAGR